MPGPQAGAVKEIHLIPYSHNDFSWCNSRQWHVARYIKSVEEVLDLMQKNDKVTWTIDNVLHSLLPFLEAVPERGGELRSRIAEGRVALVNGGMSLARPNYVGDETFIRNMVEATRFFRRELGAEVDIFYNADVACGHSQLPQLLSLGGHRFYRFWRPEEALDHKKVPRQFVWKGLDGSTITVSRGAYLGMLENAGYLRKDPRSQWAEIREEFIQLELSDRLHLLPTDVVWMSCGSDDFSLLYNRHNDPVDIPGFIEEWNTREKLPIRFSTPQAYFQELASRKLPLYEGGLDPCDLSLNAPQKGDHSLWRLRQRLDREIVRLETVAAITSLHGLGHEEPAIASLWRALFQITGHAIDWAFEQDYETLYAAALAAEDRAGRLIQEKLSALAAACVSGGREESRGSYVVMNTLGWRRRELILLHVSDPRGITGFALTDALGRGVPFQVVDEYARWNPYPGCTRNAVDVLAEVEVPSLGYTTIRVEPSEARPSAPRTSGRAAGSTVRKTVLDNGCLEATCEAGSVRGIHFREASFREGMNDLRFVQTKEQNTGVFFCWDEVRTLRLAPQEARLIESGPLRWIYRVNGRIGDNLVQQDIMIRKNEPAIGFSVTIDCTGGEGYFAADFSADETTAIFADIPFGVERRDLSAELFGATGKQSLNAANVHERAWQGQFWARSWVLFRRSTVPIALVSENCSIYYRHQKGMVTLLLNRCMPIHAKTLGPADAWAYHLHPRMDGTGRHTYRYWIFFPPQDAGYAEVARFARQRAHPLQSAWDHRALAAGAGEPGKSFLTMDQHNIILSAFCTQRDGYLVRFFETEGRATHLTLRAGFAVGSAQAVDLLGNHCRDTEVIVDADHRVLRLDVRPWQIVTLALRA